MLSRAIKFLSALFSTNRPSGPRDRILDFLGGAVGKVVFRYEPGQEMRDKEFAGPSDLRRKYRIVEQKIYTRQPYYTLIDSATESDLGLFHQDSIEPYDTKPMAHSGGSQPTQ